MAAAGTAVREIFYLSLQYTAPHLTKLVLARFWVFCGWKRETTNKRCHQSLELVTVIFRSCLFRFFKAPLLQTFILGTLAHTISTCRLKSWNSYRIHGRNRDTAGRNLVCVGLVWCCSRLLPSTKDYWTKQNKVFASINQNFHGDNFLRHMTYRTLDLQDLTLATVHLYHVMLLWTSFRWWSESHHSGSGIWYTSSFPIFFLPVDVELQQNDEEDNKSNSVESSDKTCNDGADEGIHLYTIITVFMYHQTSDNTC
jgi:hypothetical protein